MNFSDYKKHRNISNKKIVYHSIMSINRHKFYDIKQYYDEIESKFEIDKNKLSKRYDEEFFEHELYSFTKSDLDNYFPEEYFRIEDVFLKQFRYSIIVTIYSLLESSLNYLCQYLFRLNRFGLKLEEVRRDGIERAKLYLSKVCLIDFTEESKEWQEMQKLNRIRNCVVHAEGIVNKVKSPKKLINVINNTGGLEIEKKRYLKIESDYIGSAIVNAEELLDKVHDKAFAKI